MPDYATDTPCSEAKTNYSNCRTFNEPLFSPRQLSLSEAESKVSDSGRVLGWWSDMNGGAGLLSPPSPTAALG